MERAIAVWFVLLLTNPGISRGQSPRDDNPFRLIEPYRQGGTTRAPRRGHRRGKADGRYQQLLGEWNAIQVTPTVTDDEKAEREQAEHRLMLLGQIIKIAPTADLRARWSRILADELATRAMTDVRGDAMSRIQSLSRKLERLGDQETAAYVEYVLVGAKIGAAANDRHSDFMKAEVDWLRDLRGFIEKWPRSQQAPQAMMQIACRHEQAGCIEDASTWFQQVCRRYPESHECAAARGALERLDSKGKTLEWKATDSAGEPFELRQFRGRCVIVHFWATWQTEHADMDRLLALHETNPGNKLEIISVNLDAHRENAIEELNKHRRPWRHVLEGSGFNGPSAVRFGVSHVPVIMIFDSEGRVVNPGASAENLAEELSRLLR